MSIAQSFVADIYAFTALRITFSSETIDISNVLITMSYSIWREMQIKDIL